MSAYTGTGRLIRLYARQDRTIAPLWIIVLGLVPLLYAVSFEGLYPTAADRQAFYLGTLRAPAELAMVGPIFGSDLGALVTWRAGLLLTLVPLAALLTVVRHTRVDEEMGRTELLGAGALGRRAGLTAAVVFASGAVIAAGLIGTVSLSVMGFAVLGSAAFGLSIVAVGIVFAAVGACAAQIASSARTARGIGLSVLAVAFALRAVGDAGSGTLSWLSPIGWSSQLRPFAGERWWVLLLPFVATAVATSVAFAMSARRDVGSGLVPERRGPGGAAVSLSGVVGLAQRQQRGAAAAWLVGLGSIALVLGSSADGISGQLGDGSAITDSLERFGGSTLDEAFIATVLSVLGIGAAAYGISATLRLHGEEESSRAETVLAGSVGRYRWMSSHLVFAWLGPAVMMLVVGVCAAVPYGLATGDAGVVFPIVGSALAQVPAVWVLVAIGVMLFGLVPRFATAAWGALAVCVLLGQVGTVVGLPQIVLDLSPFTHVPTMPGSASAMSLAVLTAVAVLVGAAGFRGFARRDVRS